MPYKDRERQLEAQRAHYQKNKSVYLERQRAYKKAHPEKRREEYWNVKRREWENTYFGMLAQERDCRVARKLIEQIQEAVNGEQYQDNGAASGVPCKHADRRQGRGYKERGGEKHHEDGRADQ